MKSTAKRQLTDFSLDQTGPVVTKFEGTRVAFLVLSSGLKHIVWFIGWLELWIIWGQPGQFRGDPEI